ncbi:PilZ domain-containing protein [Burkholderia gladioli]|uniref:PilZ domain-containing protein n=2 Tax=Burkholderia gladioli TaxID=28095 RepID=UPI0016416F0C|nr:PilZ domain-containing protein [Burkholderia gladioli]
MPAGASLDAEEIAFLFARFAPARRADGDAPRAAPRAGEAPEAAAPSEAAFAAPRLSLPADATLGLHRRAGSTRQMSRFRLLGVHPAGPLFVRPLQPRAVDLTPGEAIEAMAIGQSAVYWFTAFVEAVAFEPAPYLILSAPGKLKRVRERRAARYVLSGVQGMGLVPDLSASGLSIAADRELGKAGESVRVALPVAAGDGEVEALALAGTLRGLTHQPEAAPAWLHHVALDAMAEADLMRLKAALFDWSLSA